MTDRRGRQFRGTDSYDDIEPDLAVLAGMNPADHDREMLRQKIIARCVPLADHIARRFGGRGELADDIAQVARIGVIHAVDRFDPARGSSFVAFAVPTVMGEVRRHFRDNTWAVRVPRRTKEIQLMIGDAVERLAQRFGRMPRTREIAAELAVDIEEVTRALVAANGYQTTPMTPVNAEDGDETATAVSALFGLEEPRYEQVEQFLAVQPLIQRLPERERRILGMRFFEYRTQTQIAQALGISQMQVSRILSRTLTVLRDQVFAEPPPPHAPRTVLAAAWSHA
ncbi:SigB/SigF/SigG family RNA polymerase sigma factor [Nocardia stercoris]|uniref:SigB/SigF/SigG family RNA polymerase sigma factor n=1 Tax=Nocardia stercoris TaxID=2483361 RepID=A0A3M2L6E3_9NOCA|nr:SigB/SigF/SigG family RNA polymerase sigma factor [Nocardia stercoris]RMI31485.1 SigB/SigF/SigG family RNA polymerase sigma factor [Nocardia stercoris]